METRDAAARPTQRPPDAARNPLLEQHLLAAIDHEETIELLRRLVAAVSENPPGGEAAPAAVLADALRAGGLTPVLEEVAPGRPNVYATYGDGQGPHLVLNAHLDTMPAGPGWTADPHQPRVAEGRLVGRGAADAKGGLAAMASAVLAVVRTGIRVHGKVTFQAVCDEEGTGLGSRAAVDALRVSGTRPDWAILAEPTRCLVARSSNGQVNVEIIFHGKGAHGSTPGAGRNAVLDAAAFALLVERASEDLAAEACAHPLLPTGTYNVGTIAGGLQTSIVPARCAVTLDRRIVPGQSVDDALGDIDRLLERLSEARPGLRAERRVLIAIPPVDVAEDTPLCRELRAAVEDVRGTEFPFVGMTATSDAATYAAAGIPSVAFGPGSMSEAAHQPDEWVDLSEVRDAACVLALTIARLVA